MEHKYLFFLALLWHTKNPIGQLQWWSWNNSNHNVGKTTTTRWCQFVSFLRGEAWPVIHTVGAEQVQQHYHQCLMTVTLCLLPKHLKAGWQNVLPTLLRHQSSGKKEIVTVFEGSMSHWNKNLIDFNITAGIFLKTGLSLTVTHCQTMYQIISLRNVSSHSCGTGIRLV